MCRNEDKKEVRVREKPTDGRFCGCREPVPRKLLRHGCRALVAVALLATGASASPQSEPPLSPLSLERAVQLVIEGNGELKAASFEVRAADVRKEYAGRFLNPTVGLDLEDFLGGGPVSGFSGAQTTLKFSQSVPLGGRLAASTDVAAARLSVAEANHASLRIHVLAETVVRFLHVVADQHRLEVAVQARELSASGVEVARRRVASGAASSVEERRASIASVRSEIGVEHAEHELLAAKRRLAMMWGETELRFGQAEADLFAPRAVTTYEDLAARIENNPELVRLVKEQAMQSARIALAESNAIPDLEVSVGGRRLQAANSFALVFGISVPLPLFQRNRGAIGAAEMKRSGLVAERDATRVRLLASLYGLTQELKHARDLLAALRTDMLPDARSVLETVTGGFRVGRFSQIELLDAQRTLVEMERERIDEAEELVVLMVRVNSILGAAELESGRPSGESHTPSPSRGDDDE